MKNISKLLVALSAVLFSCDANEPVITTSASNSYFPLQIGNRWEYEPIRPEMTLSTSAVFTIVSTETREATEYFAMERIFQRTDGPSSRDTIYYRLDSQGYVYEVTRYINGEINRFRLGANQGDTWSMGSFSEQDYVVTTSITDVTLDTGVLSECKAFSYDVAQWADEEHYFILAQGIGIVQHGNAWGFDYKLKSAKIGGVAL